jgi:hypothetical protein
MKMTSLIIRANLVDALQDYDTAPADYINLDLDNDYLIWSEDLEDNLDHEPTPSELNEHGVIIDDDADKKVPECLVMDYSHNFGGAYYTHLVNGMGIGRRFVFAFSFDGATAKEPQLEAWDDDTHTTVTKRVLGGDGVGGESPEDSMVKAIATTFTLPDSNWVGTAIAGSGAGRFIYLNEENGAVEPASAETYVTLYCNIKIVIPMAYATPAVESFVLTVRYTWL